MLLLLLSIWDLIWSRSNYLWSGMRKVDHLVGDCCVHNEEDDIGQLWCDRQIGIEGSLQWRRCRRVQRRLRIPEFIIPILKRITEMINVDLTKEWWSPQLEHRIFPQIKDPSHNLVRNRGTRCVFRDWKWLIILFLLCWKYALIPPLSVVPIDNRASFDNPKMLHHHPGP